MCRRDVGLDDLVAIVDCNGLQITGSTAEMVGVEPLADRWRAFGWTVHEVDGHDIDELAAALAVAAPGQAHRGHRAHGQGPGPAVRRRAAREPLRPAGERQHKRALAALAPREKGCEMTP